MMRTLLVALPLLCLACDTATGPPPADPSARAPATNIVPAGVQLIDLGGNDNSWANRVNAHGEIAGEDWSTGAHPWLYRDGQTMHLPLAPGTFWFKALNDEGDIVGLHSSPDLPQGRAALWRDGVMVYAPGNPAGLTTGRRVVLNSRNDSPRSIQLWDGVDPPVTLVSQADQWAAATNQAGQIVGWRRTGPASFALMLWTVDGGSSILGADAGGTLYPGGITESGIVWGFWDRSPSTKQGFLWRDGTLWPISAGAGAWTYVWAVNDAGEAVGAYLADDGRHMPFLWREGVIHELGTLGGTYTYPNAINNRGQVVGEGERSDGTWGAIVWEVGRTTDLGGFGGGYASGWHISDAGLVVGASETTDGALRAALWILPSDPLAGVRALTATIAGGRGVAYTNRA